MHIIIHHHTHNCTRILVYFTRGSLKGFARVPFVFSRLFFFIFSFIRKETRHTSLSPLRSPSIESCAFEGGWPYYISPISFPFDAAVFPLFAGGRCRGSRASPRKSQIRKGAKQHRGSSSCGFATRTVRRPFFFLFHGRITTTYPLYPFVPPSS